MNRHIVILAAGKGTRMKSSRAKVLHPLGDQTMLAHVLEKARKLSPASISIVVGYQGDNIRASFGDDEGIAWVEQTEQLGTGHAVIQAMPNINDGTTIIMYGDMPLIRAETMNRLAENAADGLCVLSAIREESRGFGRIVRDHNNEVRAIREERDCSEQERAIREVNTGFIAANSQKLASWLAEITNTNSQKEYYLTDIVEIAARQGEAVNTIVLEDSAEALGVNSKADLAIAERALQRRIAEDLAKEGVHLFDMERIDVRGELTCGENVSIDINAVFEGKVALGDNVIIGANCVLKNCHIGANSVIHAYSHIEESTLGNGCAVGPYARIRPATLLADGAKVGNFVETKKANIGKGSKVNHLSYIGDAVIGEQTNIGAGTITCNYDGANKHLTLMGDNVFIGSNSALVAPINIGDNATVGAGSTLSDDVEPNSLALERAQKVVKKEWRRSTKK